MPLVSEIAIEAPHAVVLVGDPSGEPPASLGGAIVAPSSSVIAIGTAAEGDRTVRIRLAAGQDTPQERPALQVFDGGVQLQDRLVITNVFGDVYLQHDTAGTERIRIWVDDDKEPRDVNILLGSELPV